MAPRHTPSAIDVIVFLISYRPKSVLKKLDLDVVVGPDSRH
jgi:hypothetical protein